MALGNCAGIHPIAHPTAERLESLEARQCMRQPATVGSMSQVMSLLLESINNTKGKKWGILSMRAIIITTNIITTIIITSIITTISSSSSSYLGLS